MLWGEIEVDLDDLKHIVHPTRWFDKLCDASMTCLCDFINTCFRVANKRGQVVWIGGWYVGSEVKFRF